MKNAAERNRKQQETIGNNGKTMRKQTKTDKNAAERNRKQR